MFKNLSKLLSEIEQEYGGDITFISPTSKELIVQTEKELNYQLPEVLHYFYKRETNGLKIDNKCIYSILDSNNKKTLSENLQRANKPTTSHWFKHKPEIFNDYLVIGADGQICFAIYKHQNLDNPSIYICENPNTTKEVILEKLDIGLDGLIGVMVENTF